VTNINLNSDSVQSARRISVLLNQTRWHLPRCYQGLYLASLCCRTRRVTFSSTTRLKHLAERTGESCRNITLEKITQLCNTFKVMSQVLLGI